MQPGECPRWGGGDWLGAEIPGEKCPGEECTTLITFTPGLKCRNDSSTSHVTGAITHDAQNNGSVAMRAPPSDGYKASLSNLLI